MLSVMHKERGLMLSDGNSEGKAATLPAPSWYSRDSPAATLRAASRDSRDSRVPARLHSEHSGITGEKWICLSCGFSICTQPTQSF